MDDTVIIAIAALLGSSAMGQFITVFYQSRQNKKRDVVTTEVAMQTHERLESNAVRLDLLIAANGHGAKAVRASEQAAMVRQIAMLTSRIAREHPDDPEAQRAAKLANKTWIDTPDTE